MRPSPWLQHPRPSRRRAIFWQGSASISAGGAPLFISQGYTVDAAPVYVYDKTITFTLSNAATEGEPYNVQATGRLFGNQQDIGVNGNEVSHAFGFRGTARVTTPSGKVVCQGTFVAGGRWDGDAFGELTFPSACPRVGGQQYVSFKTRVDGTSIDNVAMLQR